MKTAQGAFPHKYHHIEAPTHTDDEWGKEHKQRKLLIPSEVKADYDKVYRNSSLLYLENNYWNFKRKLDGQNMRVYWNGEQTLWNGKSDAFQCGAELTEYMNETFLEELFEEHFGRDVDVVLYGEHMGPKVQGNELELKKSEFVLFDVWLQGHWLCPEAIVEVAKNFNIKTCYDYMMYDNDVAKYEEKLTTLIDRVAYGNYDGWEGIVATPVVDLRDSSGNRIVVKIKNRDYLRRG